MTPITTEPLHEGQAQAFDLIVNKGVKRLFVLPGRGFGKTHVCCVTGAAIALSRPRARVMITYPTKQDCYDFGADRLFDILDPDIYKWRKGTAEFEFPFNRSKILLRWRGTAGAVNPRTTRRKGRGSTNTCIFHEEPASDENPVAINNFNASVRGPGAMGVYYIGTPAVGWLKNEVDKYGLGNPKYGVQSTVRTVEDPITGDKEEITAAAIYGRTRSNPYGGREMHMAMLADLDHRMASQELDGQWVALEGLIWDNWSDEVWPRGNIHPHVFTPSLPWDLSCDFGAAKSAWIAWQKVGNCYVAVAEWMHESGGAKQSLLSIREQMPTPPSRVFSGHDLRTRSIADSAMTPSYFVGQVYGAVPLIGLHGVAMDKRVRHDRMRTYISSANGQRRFCVSRNIMSDDPGGRGISKVIEQDAWPPGTARASEMMPKDGRLEHCRDALHHYLAQVEPLNVGSDGRLVI